MTLLTKEYIIETIDLEIEALIAERDLIAAKITKIEQENENIQARINILSRLIKEMENGNV